jgi:hypothetical protein
MTVLAEEFVDAFEAAVNLLDFPPTFETLTRHRRRAVISLDRGAPQD